MLEVPPAAAMASLKPPVAVSADSESVAALEIISRSDAETSARLSWSTWAMLGLDGEEGVRAGRKHTGNFAFTSASAFPATPEETEKSS